MLAVKSLKLNKIGGGWVDLGMPAVIDCVVVSPVLQIFLEMCVD
jgi:hypothetical protein